MKVGESVPVTIAGQVVAQATVKEMSDGTVTLIVPGTIVVMAVRTEIAPEVQAPVESTSETIITGVDRVNEAGEVVDSTNVGGGTPEVTLPPVTAPSSDSTVAPTIAPTTPVVESIANVVPNVETTHPVVSDTGTAGNANVGPNEPNN